MRKLVTILAAGTTLLATPALARDGAWYVGGEFGAMIVEDTDVDINTIDDALSLNHEYGYDGGLFVGYDLGAFRLEAEAAYKKADLEAFTTIIALPSSAGFHPPGTHPAGGSQSALSFMLNGMLDFGDDDGFGGYVGAGFGVARVKPHEVRADFNDGVFLEDSDSQFAWQVVAGLRQAISDNVDVTVKYRFFNVDNIRLVTWGGLDDTESRFRSHSLLGGLTFNFGAPAGP